MSRVALPPGTVANASVRVHAYLPFTCINAFTRVAFETTEPRLLAVGLLGEHRKSLGGWESCVFDQGLSFPC